MQQLNRQHHLPLSYFAGSWPIRSPGVTPTALWRILWRIMNYDPKVYELVEYFLKATPEKNTERNRQVLARHIQDELEDWTLFMLLPGDKEEA
jgi:hypothetical protein